MEGEVKSVLGQLPRLRQQTDELARVVDADEGLVHVVEKNLRDRCGSIRHQVQCRRGSRRPNGENSLFYGLAAGDSGGRQSHCHGKSRSLQLASHRLLMLPSGVARCE